MNPQVTSQTAQNLATDEHILVVKREKLFFEQAPWHGLKHVDLQAYLKAISHAKEFLPRSLMETDPAYKQIIPYLIFTHEDKYFLMQRQAKATEQRLKNKYSLGIGGHIRQEDVSSDDIIDWARREFHEEVSYNGDYRVEFLGLLNDDTNPVGQVHIGFVLLLHGTNADISVKSELKSGHLFTLEQCQEYYEHMESWSQMVFDAIKQAKN